MHPKSRDTWSLAYETREEAIKIFESVHAIGSAMPPMDGRITDLHEDVGSIKESVDEIYGWLEEMHDIRDVTDTMSEIHGTVEEMSNERAEPLVLSDVTREVHIVSQRVTRMEGRVVSLSEGLQHLKRNLDRVGAAVADVHKQVKKAEWRRVDAQEVSREVARQIAAGLGGA